MYICYIYDPDHADMFMKWMQRLQHKLIVRTMDMNETILVFTEYVRNLE